MPAINRITSIYDVDAIIREHEAVIAAVKESTNLINAARDKSIDFNINTKSFDDYNKKAKELEASLSKMDKATQNAIKASILLSKSKEAEAKAQLANTKATTAATKETERQAAAAKKAADASKKQAEAAKQNERPYKQLALAFKIASERAQDLATKYGVLDKRAQAAAREANKLNDRLKEIDSSVGINNRRVGSYNETLDRFTGGLKSAAAGFLALIGVMGVGDILKGSIDEFIEMDKNVRLLQNTLNNIGIPQAFDRIATTAERVAKQFGYLDNDDVLKVFQQLIVYGKLTEDQMNQLLPVIIDFAAATGQDLPAATSVIIKALEGNGKALKEYGINIKDAETTTEAFGIIMDQLAPKVAGVGKAFGDSEAGGLAKAQQRFKDIKEEIGSGLLPVLNSVLSVILDIGKGAIGTGRAIFDAFSGKQSLIASILGSSDNADIAFEATQVFNNQMSALKQSYKILADLQKEGKKLDVSEKDILKEFTENLRARLAEREKQYASIKQGTDRQAIMSALADIRGMQRALQELERQAQPIQATTDPNKPFTSGDKEKKGRDLAEANRRAEFEILKNSIELDLELQKTRLANEKLSYDQRLEALVAYTNRAQQLIDVTAEFQINSGELTATEILKIESDRDAARIRLARETADQLAKITEGEFKVDTSQIAESIKGIPAELQKRLNDFKKIQEEYTKGIKKLKEDTREAIQSLAGELEGLFFDIFTNALERQKNAIQDQIDLLEQQKQKDIEVANQTITNAQERADAIAVIEARSAAKRQQLELKQRQLDQQKARFEKARTIAEIVQSTSLAVVNALTQVKTLGPGAIALAAVIGAIGAVQIARALAQPIPRYADGTDNHPGGLMVVGDGGKSEGIILPDGSVYKSPATDTVMYAPPGTQVVPDYATMTPRPIFNVDQVDTTAELRKGFGQVVKAVKNIPQPIIHAERAWTQAHKTGSNFRNYLNRSI